MTTAKSQLNHRQDWWRMSDRVHERGAAAVYSVPLDNKCQLKKLSSDYLCSDYLLHESTASVLNRIFLIGIQKQMLRYEFSNYFCHREPPTRVRILFSFVCGVRKHFTYGAHRTHNRNDNEEKSKWNSPLTAQLPKCQQWLLFLCFTCFSPVCSCPHSEHEHAT